MPYAYKLGSRCILSEMNFFSSLWKCNALIENDTWRKCTYFDNPFFLKYFLAKLQSEFHLAKLLYSYVLPLHVWIWLLLLLRYNLSRWLLIYQSFSILHLWFHLRHSVWVHRVQHFHSFLLPGNHVFQIVEYPVLKNIVRQIKSKKYFDLFVSIIQATVKINMQRTVII